MNCRLGDVVVCLVLTVGFASVAGCGSDGPAPVLGTTSSSVHGTLTDDMVRDELRCPDCEIVRREMNLPVTGVVAQSIKAWNRRGEQHQIAVRGDGTTEDPDRLIGDERAAQIAKYGKLSASLSSLLSTVPPGELVWITIWSAVPYERVNRELLRASTAAMQDHTATTAQGISSAAAPIREALTRNGAVRIMDELGSPLIRARVPAEAVQILAALPEVAVISTDDYPGHPTNSAWYGTIKAGSAHGVSTGSGENICNVEGDKPDNYQHLSIAGESCVGASPFWHIAWTTAIMRTSDSPVNSVANDSNMYLGEWGCYPGGSQGVDLWCASQTARYINFSHSFSWGAPGPTEANDWHQDWVVLQPPYPLYVASGGNIDFVLHPTWTTVMNKNYNGLVVGGIDDHGTSLPADDTFWAGASWVNPQTTHNDYELPNIAAPAVAVTGGLYTNNGTSASAPMVAGTAALVGARDSSFDAYPEMTKAVLLATASTRANEGTLTHLPATTDTHLGAGVLDAYKAVVLASPNYNNANNSRLGRAAAGIDFAADFQYNFWTRTFTTGTLGKSHLRAVIAWDATPAGCDASGNSCTGSTPDADLDLSLCDDTTGYCTNSNTYDSTWEMVDLAADPTHSYSIHVQKWSTNQPGTYIGVAWYSY